MTFTATLSNPGETDVTIVTNLGEIVIAAGETTGTLFVETADPDVYIDPGEHHGDGERRNRRQLRGGGLFRGNRHGTDFDTIDTTTVSLSAADVNEDAAGVTFTATLSNPGETDVTIVTNLGEIVIAAGETTGTLFVETADPDIYGDPSSITATVGGVTGGNFEAVDFSEATATAQISDTIDTTTSVFLLRM